MCVSTKIWLLITLNCGILVLSQSVNQEYYLDRLKQKVDLKNIIFFPDYRNNLPKQLPSGTESSFLRAKANPVHKYAEFRRTINEMPITATNSEADKNKDSKKTACAGLTPKKCEEFKRVVDAVFKMNVNNISRQKNNEGGLITKHGSELNRIKDPDFGCSTPNCEKQNNEQPDGDAENSTDYDITTENDLDFRFPPAVVASLLGGG